MNGETPQIERVVCVSLTFETSAPPTVVLGEVVRHISTPMEPYRLKSVAAHGVTLTDDGEET